MRLIALLLLLTGFVWGQAPKRLLFFSHTAGFRHGSIEVAKRVLAQLSPAEFQVTSSEDLGMINAASLRGFDAIFFYTSGELALTNQQKQDLLNYVRQGGGFGGTHSATDCLYGWPEYGELIGGYFDGHPWTQPVRIDIEDPEHPIMEGVPNGFEITEEVYQFRAFSRDRVRVLMTLDPRSVNLRADGVNRADEDFALAWVHQYGQGRVFYTALGHFDEIFTDARVQRMLRNAFRWMTRLTDGPATPRGGAMQGTAPRINTVVDAAQGRFESTFSPGGIVSIYGANLTSGSTVAGAGRSARLAGTTVRLSGQALPLYFASPGQVNVLIPPEARAGALTVEAGVVRSGERMMRSQAATPGIFAVTLDRGVFVFWTTGLGELDANGRTRATPSLNVNGTNMEVLYSGIAPGFPGLYQINTRAPGAGSFDPRLAIRLEIAGAETNAQLSILNP